MQWHRASHFNQHQSVRSANLPHTANATMAAANVSRERTRPSTNKIPTVRFHHAGRFVEQTAIPNSSLLIVWFTALQARTATGVPTLPDDFDILCHYYVLFRPHCYVFQGNSVEKNGCQRFPSSSRTNGPTGRVSNPKGPKALHVV